MALLLALCPCFSPARAGESPWLSFSEAMTDLSQNPAAVEAFLKLIGQDPAAGAILGPDQIKKLREIILGKRFEELDSFPAMTVDGLGKSVSLAAKAVGENKEPAPADGAIEAAVSPDSGASGVLSLNGPAPGAPLAAGSLIKPLDFGLSVGDRIDPAQNALYPESLRLAQALNILALGETDGAGEARVTLSRGEARTVKALIRLLQDSGHAVQIRDSRYFANFGDLFYHDRDVMTPFWVNTGLAVPGENRPLLVPVSHSQHEIIVHGPAVNADVCFYFGIDGKAEFRPMVTADQSWVLGHAAHRYQGEQAAAAADLLSAIMRLYRQAQRDNPALPFGGYFNLGVCNDANAAVELAMTGKTTLYPITLSRKYFPYETQAAALFRELPSDAEGGGLPDMGRILGALPVAGLEDLPMPALARDLAAVKTAWENGTLARIDRKSFVEWLITDSLRALLMVTVVFLCGLILLLVLLRRRAVKKAASRAGSAK